jgi:putative hydrolase of the HAD superfamily
MTRVRAVIFDLDNVLYNEREYIFAAFYNIAHFLSERSQYSSCEVFSKLVHDFEEKSSLYPRLFNDVLSYLGLNQDLLPEILKLYATVDTKIELFPAVSSLLLGLRSYGLKLALVTNGNVQIQSNKIRLLGVEKFFDIVVFARETPTSKEKPHPDAYLDALQKLGVKGEETICVGDNPYTDFWGAKQIGIRTVRFLYGEFRDVHLHEVYEAEITLDELEKFPGVIEQFNHY